MDYDNEFVQLKACISKMLFLVHESLKMAIDSIEKNEIEIAKKVISLDDAVDEANRNIENAIYDMVMKHRLNPDDLRYAITMIKVVNNLERIADLGCNIAEKEMIIFEENLPFSITSDLKDMFGMVLKMVNDSFKAFASGDVKLAIDVWKQDKQIDDLEEKIIWGAVDTISTIKPSTASVKALQLRVLIARDLERVGDHVTNICEEVVYIKTQKEIPDILKLGGEKIGKDTFS